MKKVDEMTRMSNTQGGQVTGVLKRDGKSQKYDRKKIEDAIFKAIVACGGSNRLLCVRIVFDRKVIFTQILVEHFGNSTCQCVVLPCSAAFFTVKNIRLCHLVVSRLYQVLFN